MTLENKNELVDTTSAGTFLPCLWNVKELYKLFIFFLLYYVVKAFLPDPLRD